MAGLSADVAGGTLNTAGTLLVFNSSGGFVDNYLTQPLALGVDYSSDTLYVSTATSIMQYTIRGHVWGQQLLTSPSFPGPISATT